MQAIHGNPHYRPQMEQADSTQAAPTHARPAKDGGGTARAVVDQVDLSATAKQLIETAGPGKSGESPAHRARAAIALDAEHAEMPFGQVVRTLNHGTPDSLVAPPAAETGEEVAADPSVSEDSADPVGIAVPPQTDPREGADEAPPGETADILPSQTLPETDTDAPLLDLLDGTEDEREMQAAG